MATTDKYDRQLRLWGANGQRRLMTSHILLIHANGVGAETLKNLVLPGVGNFTILDDYIVNHNDLSANFFVTAESVGKPRAEVVRDLLCEMNPDVNGHARVANFQNILQTEPSFFESFQLIITANLPESHVLPLSQLCFEKRINLVMLRSFGLIGAIRLQLTTHSIIEAKKDQTSFDLRICDSFPALADYCSNYPDFQSLNSMEHAHIPFIVILYRALQHWKESHQGNVPSTAADKKEFQEAVKRLSHNLNNEVNFQEALKDYYYAYKRSTPSSELQALIDKQRQRQLGRDDEAFNFLVRALQIFLEQNNSIVPLSGLLPDMTSTTDSYVQLQSIFHEKAAQDRALFKQILLQQLQHVGTDLQISEEDVEIFCKNCQTVAQIETTSFHDEVVNGAESSTAETIIDVLQNDLYEDPAQTPLIWYLGLRAVDAFYQKYARWPGSSDDTVQHDQQEVFQELSHLARSIQIPSDLIASNDLAGSEAMETEGNTPLISLAHAVEMTRYGGHEFHNICSIIGGIAAQEVVKIITHQYEPLNNTYIFNGIACCGAVYSL